MKRVLAGVLGAWILSWASPAAAHAESVDVSPAPCSELNVVDEIRLGFSAELDAENTAATASIGGVAVASAGLDLTDLDRKTVVLTLPANLSGTIDVEWENRSAADGDFAAGTFAFSVGSAIGDARCELSETYGESGAAFPVVPVGLILAVGGITTAAVVSRRRELSVR